jgi:hypothetical protein
MLPKSAELTGLLDSVVSFSAVLVDRLNGMSGAAAGNAILGDAFLTGILEGLLLMTGITCELFSNAGRT